METTDNKILDKIEDIFEHIKIIIEDSIIRDSELEVCFRALDIALERTHECGILKTQLEIANTQCKTTNKKMEEVIKYDEMIKGSNYGWTDINDKLPSPNTDKEYLVTAVDTDNNPKVYMATFGYSQEYNKWCFYLYANNYGTIVLDNVIAWREKLLPYKRKEQEWKY